MNFRILVIDDDEMVHKILAARLRADDVAIFHELSADGGLAAAVRIEPDLVFLDLNLGQRSGLDVCRDLRATPSLARVPVVFITGTIDLATRVRCFTVGASDFLAKPFTAESVQRCIRRVRDETTARTLASAPTPREVRPASGAGADVERFLRPETELAARGSRLQVASRGANRPIGVMLLAWDAPKTLPVDTHDHVLGAWCEALSARKVAGTELFLYGLDRVAAVLLGSTPDRVVDAAKRLHGVLPELEVAAAGQTIRGQTSRAVLVVVGANAKLDPPGAADRAARLLPKVSANSLQVEPVD